MDSHLWKIIADVKRRYSKGFWSVTTLSTRDEEMIRNSWRWIRALKQIGLDDYKAGKVLLAAEMAVWLMETMLTNVMAKYPGEQARR